MAPPRCAPAVYGPSVAPQSYFDAADFPRNMEAIWDAHFGFVPATKAGCVVVGEWGGWNLGNDAVWQRAFSAYLSHRQISHFYWALNPTSRDTGGLVLADWFTPSSLKLTMLSSMPATPIAAHPGAAGGGGALDLAHHKGDPKAHSSHDHPNHNNQHR